MTPAESMALELGLQTALMYTAGDAEGVNRILLGEYSGLAVEGLLGMLGTLGRRVYGEDGWRTFLQQASALQSAENILNEVSCHG